MSKISKHKQNKRKARQRQVQARKVKERQIDREQAKLEEQIRNNFGSEHAMSDEMKSDAKKSMWKVFSSLPPELQDQVLKEYTSGKNKVDSFDIEGVSNLLGETINRYMHPHALVEVLEWMEDAIELTVPDELRPLIEQLDKEVVAFIGNASLVLGRFEVISKEPDPTKRSEMLYEDETISDRLIPALTSYQQTYDDVITPIMEFAEQYADLVDERVKAYAEENNIESIQEATRAIHLKRVEKHFDREAIKNATI